MDIDIADLEQIDFDDDDFQEEFIPVKEASQAPKSISKPETKIDEDDEVDLVPTKRLKRRITIQEDSDYT